MKTDYNDAYREGYKDAFNYTLNYVENLLKQYPLYEDFVEQFNLAVSLLCKDKLLKDIGELKVEYFRTSGALLNQNAAGVRLTHIESGLHAQCGEFRVRQQNYEKAHELLLKNLQSLT